MRNANFNAQGSGEIAPARLNVESKLTDDEIERFFPTFVYKDLNEM